MVDQATHLMVARKQIQDEEATPSMTGRSLSRSPVLLSSFTTSHKYHRLVTKPLTHRPLRAIPDPNYSAYIQ
jgi:hypothetical protein